MRVWFRLDPTPALIDVLRGSIQFQAAQAGCEKSEVIAGAAETFCREEIAQRGDISEWLEVVLNSFADRIEVSVAGRAERIGSKLALRVDRILYKSEDGRAWTTLVQLLHPAK